MCSRCFFFLILWVLIWLPNTLENSIKHFIACSSIYSTVRLQRSKFNDFLSTKLLCRFRDFFSLATYRRDQARRFFFNYLQKIRHINLRQVSTRDKMTYKLIIGSITEFNNKKNPYSIVPNKKTPKWKKNPINTIKTVKHMSLKRIFSCVLIN